MIATALLEHARGITPQAAAHLYGTLPAGLTRPYRDRAVVVADRLAGR